MASSNNNGSGASDDVPAEWMMALSRWEINLGKIKATQDAPTFIEVFTSLNEMLGVMTKMVNKTADFDDKLVKVHDTIAKMKPLPKSVDHVDSEPDDDVKVKQEEFIGVQQLMFNDMMEKQNKVMEALNDNTKVMKDALTMTRTQPSNADPWHKVVGKSTEKESEKEEDGDKAEKKNHFDEKSILEIKSIENIQALKDGDTYKEWLEQFVNRMDSAKPGYERIIEWVKDRFSGQTITQANYDLFKKSAGVSQTWDEACKQVNRVLVDKLQGKFKDRYKAGAKIHSADGVPNALEGLREVHQWQTQVTGQTLQQKKANTLFPKTPSKESDIPKVIVDWEKECVEVQAMLGNKVLHTDESRKSVLLILICGRVRDTIMMMPNLEEMEYEELRTSIIKCATPFMLEGKGNVNEVEPGASQSDYIFDPDTGEYLDINNLVLEKDYDATIDALGKGKAKGKGKTGDGQGKGKGKGKGYESQKGSGKGNGKANFNNTPKFPDWKYSEKIGWYSKSPLYIYQYSQYKPQDGSIGSTFGQNVPK